MKINEYKISIALATYNGEKYIKEQIISILNQTIKPDEIIISDDNSNDETVNIINNILSDSEISFKIIKNKYQRGYASNFNSALEMCSGDIIFLCDQDDFWNSNKIETVLKHSTSQNFLIMCDMSVADDNLSLIDNSILKLKNIENFEYNYGCAMAVSRSILNIALPIPYNNIPHDIWISLLSEILSVKKVINEVLQVYRRHGGNVTTELAKEKETLLQKIINLRNLKINLENETSVLTIAINRINNNTLHVNHFFNVNRDKIKEINKKINMNKARLNGSTFDRIAQPFHYYKIYRSNNISLLRFIKDSLVLNKFIQKNSSKKYNRL